MQGTSAGFRPSTAFGATVLAYEHVTILAWLERLGGPLRIVLLIGALLMLSVTSWGEGLGAGGMDVVIGLGALFVVAIASMPEGPLPSFLRKRPVAWLGSRSFSLYLVHEPIVVTLAVATGADVTPALFVLIVLPVALLAAEGFYRAIEHPSHMLARRFRSGPGTPAPTVAVAR